eukprot:Tamp_06964.p1 GENE.Tamp_06964~~Tamp_06964.p1  ORF type:complete len:845 (-),score=150.88 Tamp_06964:64-2436(-)
MPGCTCQVEWGSTELKYSHMDVEAVEVEVNVSCASVRRAGVHTLESVRVTMNGFSRDAVEMLDPPVVLRECFSPDELLASGDGAQQSPERLPELRAHNRSSAGSEEADELRERCAVRAQLLRRRTVPTAHIHAHALKHYNKLISFEVDVGPGSPCTSSDQCEACDIKSAMFWIDADVRVWVHYKTLDDSLTRLLLGIIFAIVWVLIMSVPLILWLRRRRAQARERMAAQLVTMTRTPAVGTLRRGARTLGVRTKPRRFKALKVSDWAAERGISRRRHGWVLASPQVAQDAEGILQSDPGVLGRHAPDVVVAKLTEGWITIKRAAVRGQPRTVEVSEAHGQPAKDPAQVYDYVLITLPESVRYSEGVTGEIAIDIYGNIVEWAGARDSEGFRAKVEILRQQIDRARKVPLSRVRDKDEFHIKVSRTNLWSSSLEALEKISNRHLLKRLHVTFDGEDGSDFGGVRREWYHLITLEMVKEELGLFELVSEDTYAYQLAPHLSSTEAQVGAQSVVKGDLAEKVRQIGLVGKILAKCIVDQQLSSSSFSSAVYKKLLLKPFTVEDLVDVDSEMHQSLEWIMDCNADEEDLGMYMCVDSTDKDGRPITIDLVQGGRDKEVTEANKTEFVDRMLHWRLVDRVAVQMDALVAGFHSVLPLEYLEPFDEHELELLLCGSTIVDVNDWRANTLYKSGYSADSEVIGWFWDLVNKMKNEERLSLLQFVTGTSALPARGFAHLMGSDGNRRFSILRVSDVHRLPQAHTCFNELVLPEYETREDFESKLLQSLSHLDDGILLR